MTEFVFGGYSFSEKGEAAFSYRYGNFEYQEKISFKPGPGYDNKALDRALFLAYLLIGVSYYKSFPTRDVSFTSHSIDSWQADFLNKVYQEGLGQFAYENGLTRSDLAFFSGSGENSQPVDYDGSGVIALQSGGKDSLLLATILQKKGIDFTSAYISSGTIYPGVIDDIGAPVKILRREIDIPTLSRAAEVGGMNGHVPVTYIVSSIALIQAILESKDTILTAIGHEGEEPHTWAQGLSINHQWSKTWQAEQLFAEYVKRYVSSQIKIGSPLRQYSELKIAEQFVQECWPRYGSSFSSCNVANYRQGADNSRLTWCGRCPKCANSYLLFAPFVEASALHELFGGRDLFCVSELTETFKGLLGIDDVIKPFECVGEVDELRVAYHMAQSKGGYLALPYDVPLSTFDIETRYPSQRSLVAGW